MDAERTAVYWVDNCKDASYPVKIGTILRGSQ